MSVLHIACPLNFPRYIMRITNNIVLLRKAKIYKFRADFRKRAYWNILG